MTNNTQFLSPTSKGESLQTVLEAIMANWYKEGYIQGYKEGYRQGYKEVNGKDLTPEQELVVFKDLEAKAEKAAEKYCRKRRAEIQVQLSL